MAKRPVMITVLATLFLLVPPCVVLYLTLSTGGNMEMAASAITLNLLVLVLGTYIVGLGLWRVKPWGFFALFLFSASVIGFNVYKIFVKQPLNFLDISLLVGVTSAMAISLRRQISAPYFNPRMRWWERADRINVDLLANFEFDGKWKQFPILDLSSTGVFAAITPEVSAGTEFKMRLQVSKYDLEVDVRVIRGTPNGLGLIFVNPKFRKRREIQQILKYLKSLSESQSHAV